MKILAFLKLLLSSFNPDSYRGLTGKKLNECFQYLFTVIILGMLISGLFLLFKAHAVPTRIDNILSQFDSFKIDFDIEAKKPVILLERPKKVVLDLSQNATLKDEDILITENYVYRKFLDPNLLKLELYNVEQIGISQYSDIIGSRDTYMKVIYALLIVLVPSIILFIFILISFKYLLVIHLLTLIGILYCRLRGLEAKALDIYIISIFSSTSMVLIDVLSFITLNLGVLPYVVYIIMFFIGLNLISEKRLRKKRNKND